MSGEAISSPHIEYHSKGVILNPEVFSALIAANTSKAFAPDDSLQIVSRNRSPDEDTAMYNWRSKRIDIFRSARYGEPQDEVTCNFYAAHELKHFIDDHEGSLAKEKLLYYGRKESGVLITLGLGTVACMQAIKNKMPRKHVASIALATSAIAGMHVRKRLNESIFASAEDRKEARDALPWEQRANDFAKQHKDAGLVRF